MTHFEVKDALESLTVLIDTREHVDTPGFQRRAAHFPRWRREKLDAGDYSAELTISEQKFRIPVAIERKMSIDELCQCFGRERARFMREFERAKENGTAAKTGKREPFCEKRTPKVPGPSRLRHLRGFLLSRRAVMLQPRPALSRPSRSGPQWPGSRC